MFNQLTPLLYLLVLVVLYLSVKIYDWCQGNGKSLWHRDNERIGREGLMIQLEEVRKQRDEIASQLMAVRLENQKPNSKEPEPEPQGYKEFREFNDFLRKEYEEIKGMIIELDKAYAESQRELNELKSVSKEFVKGFEYDYMEDGVIIDCTQSSFIEKYKELKSILK